MSVTLLCSPFGLELIVKLRTLLAVFTFTLKAEACIERGFTFPKRGVWPNTMRWVSWPIRSDCAFQKAGVCRKQRV